MRRIKLAKTSLAVKAALLIGGSYISTSFAAEVISDQTPSSTKTAQKTNKEKQKEIEIIEVSGFASSLKKNLNTKRFADVVLDSISAEDIGKFPDQNVADSLARISGVSIESNFGEGESVSIRGTAPGLNRTLLNGQNVATSDWNALSLGKREFNFTLIPSVMVKQLEVLKTPTADIDEGSLGGTIMMRTRKPLEMDNGSGAISYQQQYSDKSEKWDPQFSALFSLKNEDETLGALVTYARQDNSLRRDGIQTHGWTQSDLGGRSDVWHPKIISSNIFEQKRERESIMLTLEWIPVAELDVTFNALNSRMDADNVSQAYYLMVDQSLNLGAVPTNIVFDDVNGDTALGMVIPDVENGSPSDDSEVQLDTRNRKAFFETQHYDLDLQYEGDNYTLHAQAGYTEAKGGNRFEVATAFFADTAIAYDNTQGVPQGSLLDMDINDTDAYSLRLLSVYDRPQHDDELYGQLDFEYEFETNFITSVKTGVKYRDHVKSQRANLYQSKRITEGYDESYYDELVLGNETSLSDYSAGPSPENFLEDNAAPGSITNFPTLDFDAFEQEIRPNLHRFSIAPLLNAEFDIKEVITAAYVRANFEYDDLRGNIGVRYVETDLDSSSWLYSGPYLNPAHKEWVTTSRTYTDVLPSLNLAYGISDNVLMRFAAAKVMARPGYGNLSGYRGLNDIMMTGSGGNPDLDPYRATQYDLSWEWYINDTGGFSTAIFYKDIESYLTSEAVIESHYHKESSSMRDYTIDVKSNGTGGQNVGFELNYQQDIYKGFGLITNYTFSKSTTQSGDKIPGNSEDTLNFTAYYEKGPLSTRISYNYRSEYFLYQSAGNDVWVDATERWDMSFSYKIFEKTSLILQGVNLTDEHSSRYADEMKYRHLATFENGRKFRIGVHHKF
ncbi:TonB-dependent receptor [Colwellia piezophila]|uniref:TonB-dependent receptor n=1 Tax=Colwellia piezophila TaxID=211668 RepID=UPI00037E7C92|nr:TonB-dependent receptor [Colwellia piezophila]